MPSFSYEIIARGDIILVRGEGRPAQQPAFHFVTQKRLWLYREILLKLIKKIY